MNLLRDIESFQMIMRPVISEMTAVDQLNSEPQSKIMKNDGHEATYMLYMSCYVKYQH